MTNKYLKIFNDIVDQIESGEVSTNSLLPSENELRIQYDTSRETIRKALNLLAQKGYIQKIRGKGSLVIENGKFNFPVSGLISFKELADKMEGSVRTIAHDVSLIKPTPYIQKQLQLTNKDLVWQVIRTREINGKKIILDKDYFHQKIVPELTKEISEDSIYHYLEKELHLPISFAKKEVTVVEPTAEDRQFLDLEGFYNVVVIRNYVYLEDATLFQYTESRHRPDKFKFVDFARRNH